MARRLTNRFRVALVVSFLSLGPTMRAESDVSIPEFPGVSVLKAQGVKAEQLVSISTASQGIITDNPAPLTPPAVTPGADPLLGSVWGFSKIAAELFWADEPGEDEAEAIVVAVIDTGVDYNHEDLIHNIWRNEKEIPDDGIDNDENGFVDDVMGWDFVDKDNRPFDMPTNLTNLFISSGNPGHGTHISGVIAASYGNSLGISGVAPTAKIMIVRAMDAAGHGDTERSVAAINYAVTNGAKIINASWETRRDKKDEGKEKALREALDRAEKAGVIFVAAAGNGRDGRGFDNDRAKEPILPATLPNPNIIAVAATDENDKLARFSNWGKTSIDIAAPGVKVLSTVPGNRYQDTVLDFGTKKVTWDGTSMAAPFVAGVAAAHWARDPGASWETIRQKTLENVVKTPALEKRLATGGRIAVK